MDQTVSLNDKNNIEINDDFLRAIEAINSGKNGLFITGKPGTGKSTFLDFFRTTTKKKAVVLAPTGVAAVNIQGQTIHSFFNFKPDITVDTVPSVKFDPSKAKLYKRLELVIIDEISMVRSDLMDCIDAFLRLHGPDREKSFGGVQMVYIGDLYQLEPVVPPNERHIFQTLYRSPYFFDSQAVQKTGVETIEFRKNYRQNEQAFLKLLDAIRTGQTRREDIDTLNTRYQPGFIPPEDQFYMHLTTTNKLADQINRERLDALKEDLFTYEGRRAGDFSVKNLPTHESLDLKIGAHVMLLNNDPEGRWVNGSVGRIEDIFSAGFNSVAVLVKLADGVQVEVEPFKWEIFEFYYNEKKDGIDSRIVGSFKQFPIKLAWAITIHKSQGKTFNRVIIDIGNGAFCHGQIYVALSRCTAFGGIVLKQKIAPGDIRVNSHVTMFDIRDIRTDAD
ncbi:MAG: DEAD/DEAH box helicase [Candidatus Omnitrophota bacterium]